jgi:hypothetical protein
MMICSVILRIVAVLDLIIAVASYLSNDISGFRYMMICTMLVCILESLTYIRSRIGDRHEY